MNCKPGDMAIFVRSDAGNEGKIVRVLHLLPGRVVRQDGSLTDGPLWKIDPPVKSWVGTQVDKTLDSNLRPIRDPGDDAVDETLQRLPAPQRAKEMA